MINDEKKKFIELLPFYTVVLDQNQKILYRNKLWRNIQPQVSDLRLSEERIFLENGLSEIIKKVFRGEINYITKPLFCDYGFLSFTENFNNRFLKFTLFPESVNGNLFVYVLIELTESEIEDKRYSPENSIQSSVINVLQILESERERISSDLHDEVIQNLLVAKLELDLFLREQDIHSEKLTNAIDGINIAIDDIRGLIQSMHPALIKKNGIIKATEMLLSKLKTSMNIDAELKIFGNYFFSSSIIEINIYRIIQEALNNIKKHSEASKIDLQLHFTENMIIGSIIDNGKGFNLKEVMKNSISFGLISMQERIKSVKGELFFESDQKGTKIIFHIPVRGKYV